MPSTDHGRRDALPAGRVLREFTIQAVIGHGGFGIVYRAGHNELDLTVAIKEYLPVELAVREGTTVQPRSGTAQKDFEDGLRRFRDEAQALIDFDSHPSIVSCREFFRAHGTAYLVMAYEDGPSLAEVLASREAEGRPFTESDLQAVMQPMLEGLARVHAAGVLHRDIKPSNILIRRRDGRPVLIDFGAAKQAAAQFSKSQAPYTEGYAAPEQVADAGKLGPWTDIYGVGAVMWRMVAGGNRPWESPHPVRVEQRSHAVVGGTEDPMPKASELGKGRFPSRLLEVIDRCLRLPEAQRIQGSTDLLEALRAVGEQPPQAASKRPQAIRTDASRQDPGSDAELAGATPRTGWRRIGWVALASMAFGLGLMVATWWNSGSEETVRDQAPGGASGGRAGEIAVPEREEALDSVPSSGQRAENRESPPEANGADQTPDPNGTGSGREDEHSGTGGGQDSDDKPEVRPEGSQDSLVQPWVRDWDALGDINDPDFVLTTQAYIERYKQVPEASVRVAQAEGLLAKLRRLEAESSAQREAGEAWMNSLGMDFVWIPAGHFVMGSSMEEGSRDADESQHEVRISKGFWMNRYEVTQGEWEAVTGANPSHFFDCGLPCPVENVSWDDTVEFVRALNSRESGSGYAYRLPTEAEWEYAARAGATGVRYGELGAIAWYVANSGSRTHPVGQKRANAWGLHDMLGSVWEWTGDWYGEYPSGVVTDPAGPESGSYRVIRGGSWYSYARHIRSAYRFASDDPGYRNSHIGFRLVRTE